MQGTLGNPVAIINTKCLGSGICCLSFAYLHHFYSKGTGTARRFLIQRSLRPQTGQSRAYWPTSPSEEPCPPPRPRAACPGSSPVKVSGCPCGSPSGIGVSLFVPCCGQRKGKGHINGERWRQTGTEVRGIRRR